MWRGLAALRVGAAGSQKSEPLVERGSCPRSLPHRVLWAWWAPPSPHLLHSPHVTLRDKSLSFLLKRHDISMFSWLNILKSDFSSSVSMWNILIIENLESTKYHDEENYSPITQWDPLVLDCVYSWSIFSPFLAGRGERGGAYGDGF